MEAMASGSSSSSKLAASEELCSACGAHRLWTPRMWECFGCSDHFGFPNYFLCEDCHRGLEAISPHNPEHYMLSLHVAPFSCNGCGSKPIWNVRWHCKVCADFDLCEVCYGGLDAADMPSGHSSEHAMIAVEVFSEGNQCPSSFSKPVDPQWSYTFDNDMASYGFVWAKRKPLVKVLSKSLVNVVKDDPLTPTSRQANEDDNNISQHEVQSIQFE